MARKRNKSGFEVLIDLFALMIQIIVVTLYRIVAFIYDFISFYTSKYKQKSGLSFIKMYLDKGHYGEFQLYRKVIRVFGKTAVLTNIYLEGKNTELTEIDVLAVSNKGIYVFEMKNYAGYIYGSEKDKTWTQVFNKWVKHKFYNPLRQNYAHTKAVESFLEVESDQVIPIVVFSNRSKLSKINISEVHNVFQFRNAVKFIKKNEKYNRNQISDIEKQTFLVKLLERCHMPDEVKVNHILEVQALIQVESNG